MRALDRLLQRWRIAKARPYIRPGSRVLDVGCHDGALFRQIGARVAEGVGVDPELQKPVAWERVRLLPGSYPEVPGETEPFDAITMLAVLEHLPAEVHGDLASACSRDLKPGGHLIITVPSPLVDKLLELLHSLRLIDGMSMEQHHGFRPAEVPAIFSGHQLTLTAARKFQLGLNNLFVFRKDPETS